MQDWSMVAAIVAIVTIPLFASPFLLNPAIDLVREYVVGILYRKSRCDAIRWQNLSDHPLQVTSLRTTRQSTTRSVGSSNARIISYFERTWGARARPEERPRYLQLRRRYLRIDTDALTAALMLDGGAIGGTMSGSAERSSFNIHYGSVAGRFRYHEADDNDDTYLIGSLRSFPRQHDIDVRFRGLSKHDLLNIAMGYPPFYRETFKSTSGVDVNHPVREQRDTVRAAWVVAIGFGSNWPVSLYNGGFLEKYEEACSRVLHRLDVLAKAFNDNPKFTSILKHAVDGVKTMNSKKTGSVLTQNIHRIIFGDTRIDEIGKDLTGPQIHKILNLFKDSSRDKLSDAELNEFQNILPEVLKGAVMGVYAWWQYKNNQGNAIPGWLLEKRMRQCPIWLEDREEGT